ncbi:MAG: VIT1/CCC1 transporter family protein [Deltaproteobacteria bacterium]|nr:VIT1/CCC1 transporter family protein [Deltaproteobacteria bacterium]
MLSADIKKQLLGYQRSEITEHHIYRRLARIQKSPENRKILERIAEDEKRHYNLWKIYTGEDAQVDWSKVRRYYWITRIFGLTFGTKLMERGEVGAQKEYAGLPAEIDQAQTIAQEESDHENALLGMLDEERLRYIGSVVLGLNDALIELTGALAGLTLALQNTQLIALTGSITGIAAALSMAASEYLSTKAEGGSQQPLKAAFYTGMTYVVTVVLLIAPYLLLPNYFVSLACTLSAAVLIIALFNFYISVAMDQPFKKRFAEMAILSLGVAGLSFLLGLVLRVALGVEV